MQTNAMLDHGIGPKIYDNILKRIHGFKGGRNLYAKRVPGSSRLDPFLTAQEPLSTSGTVPEELSSRPGSSSEAPFAMHLQSDARGKFQASLTPKNNMVNLAKYVPVALCVGVLGIL